MVSMEAVMTSNSSSGIDLSLSLIRDSLSSLGKHPFALSHTYLALKVVGKNIGNIEIIKDYSNLMYIDLSDNSLVSLKPLENLSALVQLKARFHPTTSNRVLQYILNLPQHLTISFQQIHRRNNLIKDCLAFSPKRCSNTFAWPDGQRAVGSLLAMVDLTGNQIETIEDLLHHRFLECLIISSNRISKISGLENLKYLQILDLSYNKIKEIEGLEGLLITELNLEGNEISSLRGLTKCPRLSVLNIAQNNIVSLAPLTFCSQLHNLNVSGNQIQLIRQVEFLTELNWLKKLNLSGNPCCTKQSYRARVLFRLESLQELDVTLISSEERIRASNMYDAEGGDLQYRQAVLAKYYPEERFETFSPYFEDDELFLELTDACDEINDSARRTCSSQNRVLSEDEYDTVKTVRESFLHTVISAVCHL